METDEEIEKPVSPIGLYFNSSVVSVSVLAILEFETLIDESQAISLTKSLLLPRHPRFSSIMVNDINGEKKWRRVEVNPENHVYIPTFPAGLSLESYDEYFDEYLTKIGMEPLPQTKPLWEIHIFNYPTRNAASNMILKLHHALGDGYSLMGVLFSCLRRADNPSLPLTFPSRKSSENDKNEKKNLLSNIPRVLSNVMYSMLDFSWSTRKSCALEDDVSAIRSGGDGVEFRPFSVTALTFSLEKIKKIKTKLKVTINDVLTGMIFYGIRLYIEEVSPNSGPTHSTVLVMLNTRMAEAQTSVEEMLKPNSNSPWGNRVAFMHLPIPNFSDSQLSSPLQFVKQAQKMVKKKRTSFTPHLTATLMEIVRKLIGPEEGAKLLYNTLKNSSTTISNMMGPVEQMTLSNHPVKGMYFMMTGGPQSLIITIVSYMENLRIAFRSEKGFIDRQKFKSCMERTFEMIFEAANQAST